MCEGVCCLWSWSSGGHQEKVLERGEVGSWARGKDWAECGDENSSGCASLQRCEALLWVLPVTWKRVAPWAQQDSAEAWQCDRSCKVVVGGGSVVSGRGTFIPPPGLEP